MDVAEEDQDIRLERASSDLLADLQKSLKPFLWKSPTAGNTRIRRRVRVRETERLVSLLEPFQELPQLLDPHLGQFLPVLADGLLEYLRSAPDPSKTKATSLLMPLSEAISKLLYTFCKIRGEKVVVRFFGAETRHLELLLSAIEAADKSSTGNEDSEGWSWEERYITLLWLSHLLLVPFDLASISSSGTAEASLASIPDIIWPPNLPGVALRVIPIAFRYLKSAGKERDAAKILLVRISMRRDMQQLGLLDTLVKWALSSLRSSNVASSTYYYIGILSYLAGVLVSSATTSDMDPFLSSIFNTVHSAGDNSVEAFQSIASSALARKTVIKVLRTVAVLELRSSTKSPHRRVTETAELVETTIGHMLEALADNDTPVRLAASKALSIITQKLAPVMAAQVVEAVIDSLNHNVLWASKAIGKKQIKIRDLSAVNPLEWHGLILTLSQLLYRRSPPPDTLSEILHSLLIGLSFERRSTSGNSVGTNVRDAACFGIWALARRYTTAELQAIDRASILTAEHHDKSSSVIQVLATELVVAAALDSAGNIRRGASAALQELIGRHPDAVENGIAVVQTVDYHRVALRSKAMQSVGPDAAILSKHLEDALLNGLFGWRGLGDGDAISRRNAATCIGSMAALHENEGEGQQWERSSGLLDRIQQELSILKPREVDLRHGLLLALAAVFEVVVRQRNSLKTDTAEAETILIKSLQISEAMLKDASSSKYRRPELIAEASCRIVSPTCALLRGRPYDPFWVMIESCIDTWLNVLDRNVMLATTKSASSFAEILTPTQRTALISKWTDTVILGVNGREANGTGHLLALGGVFSVVSDTDKKLICQTFQRKWRSSRQIENRAALLQALHGSEILQQHSTEFVSLIAEGLDDYTTDVRGDIGSLVRIEALKAAGICFKSIPTTQELNATSAVDLSGAHIWYENAETFGSLYAKVLRLAVEKLDKVRVEAHQALICLFKDQADNFDETTHILQSLPDLQVSSQEYFTWFLALQTIPRVPIALRFLDTLSTSYWIEDLLEGYVTSADTGSEGLIKGSRAALAEFCILRASTETSNSSIICEALLRIAKRNIENDRVLVPAMEVISFLFDAGVMQEGNISNRSLFVTVQKAHFKSGNVRKLEAAVKIYGGLLDVGWKDDKEVLKKLSTMLLHPFPAVRAAVIDLLFIKRGVGKGVDWTKARKEWAEVKTLRESLGIE